MSDLTEEELKGLEKTPAFQVANDEGLTDLKAIRAPWFDTLLSMSRRTLKAESANKQLEAENKKLTSKLNNALSTIEDAKALGLQVFECHIPDEGDPLP